MVKNLSKFHPDQVHLKLPLRYAFQKKFCASTDFVNYDIREMNKKKIHIENYLKWTSLCLPPAREPGLNELFANRAWAKQQR